jgi:hypothetical protein
MKRLDRGLLNALTVLSLVLCVATVVLWVRSYFEQDLLELRGGGDGGRTFYAVALGNGRLGMERQTRFGGPADLPRRWVWVRMPAGDPYMVRGWGRGDGFWQRMGFAASGHAWAAAPGGYAWYRWAGVAPAGVICLALFVLPAWGVNSRVCRSRGRREGRRGVVAGMAAWLIVGTVLDARLAPPAWGWQPGCWALAAIVGAGTGILVWQRCRRRGALRDWREHGVCLACGYDLTGNVSGVCPECGTALAKGNA